MYFLRGAKVLLFMKSSETAHFQRLKKFHL